MTCIVWVCSADAYYAHGNQATALHHSETGVEQTLAGCGTTEESSVAPWTQTDTQQEEEDVEEGEVKVLQTSYLRLEYSPWSGLAGS